MPSVDPFARRPLAGANFVFFGGSAGIGLATATALAREGANLLVVGRNVLAGEEAVAGLRVAGAASAQFLAGDLSTAAGVLAVAHGVQAWRPALHGVLHTAMSAFNGKKITADGFEFAFALQYFARAALNRLLKDALAASGDGRIVHIAGNVPGQLGVDLDDLQFERRRWGFFKAVLSTHALGFMHIQEATRRWQGSPVTLSAACVNSTRTKAMTDPAMPFIMRLMGRFGTTPEASAANAIRLLAQDAATHRLAAGCVLRNPKAWAPQLLQLPQLDAGKLWSETTRLARSHGLPLAD